MIDADNVYRYENTWVYKDKGSGHFSGDFEHDVEVVCHHTGNNYVSLDFWMISNNTRGYAYLDGKQMAARIYKRPSSPYFRMAVLNYDGSSSTSSYLGNCWVIDAKRYCTIKRVGSLLYLYIYTDAARTNQVTGSPISLTCNTDAFSNIFAFSAYTTTAPGYDQMSIDVENLDLKETTPPPPSYTNGLPPGSKVTVMSCGG